jgi:hypothetical protein
VHRGETHFRGGGREPGAFHDALFLLLVIAAIVLGLFGVVVKACCTC